MSNISRAKQKLIQSQAVISTALHSGRANESSQRALKVIKKEFSTQLESLQDVLDLSVDIQNAWCADTRRLLNNYLPYVGLLIRSSDIRNSFEIYDPIERLATKLISRDARVIVSAEWNYNPLVYPEPHQALRDFVFVGLPVSEVQNALLMPVAAHELGHAVWRRHSDLVTRLVQEMRNSITDILSTDDQPILFDIRELPKKEPTKEFMSKQSMYSQVHPIVTKQIEEIFCDVLGCYVYGAAYVLAFHYLLSPEISAARPRLQYPKNHARAGYIERACIDFFGSSPRIVRDFKSTGEKYNEIGALADRCSESLVDTIIKEVKSFAQGKKIRQPKKTGIDNAIKYFRSLTPVIDASDAEILIGAWILVQPESFIDLVYKNEIKIEQAEDMGVNESFGFGDLPSDEAERSRAVNELVFKSFDIIEYKKKMR